MHTSRHTGGNSPGLGGRGNKSHLMSIVVEDFHLQICSVCDPLDRSFPTYRVLLLHIPTNGRCYPPGFCASFKRLLNYSEIVLPLVRKFSPVCKHSLGCHKNSIVDNLAISEN